VELKLHSPTRLRGIVVVVIIIIIIIIKVCSWAGHLLTRSGLTYPEISSMVFPGSFRLLVRNVLLPSSIRYEAFC
jgi:hypothetical protein